MSLFEQGDFDDMIDEVIDDYDREMDEAAEHLTDAARAAKPLLAALYKVEPCGGWMHIVTDDLNCETHHVEWCKERCVRPEEHAIADAFLLMTEEERNAAILFWEGRIG